MLKLFRESYSCFCDSDANPTDEYGNTTSLIDHVYCKRCSYELVIQGKGEICTICENFSSKTVSIENEELKPIYIPGTTRSSGMCKDHP